MSFRGASNCQPAQTAGPSQDHEQPGPSRRKRQLSMSESMPLYTLCKEDLESMDKEVRGSDGGRKGGGSISVLAVALNPEEAQRCCWEQQSPHTQVNQPLNLGPRQCVMSSGWPVPSSAILKTSSCLCKMAPREQPNLRAEPPIQYPEFTAAKNSSVPALVGTQD